MISFVSERNTSPEPQKYHSLALSSPGLRPRKRQIALVLLFSLSWSSMREDEEVLCLFSCAFGSAELPKQGVNHCQEVGERLRQEGLAIKPYADNTGFFLQWQTHLHTHIHTLTHMGEKPPWWPESHYWEQSCLCADSVRPLRPSQCSLTFSEILSSLITSTSFLKVLAQTMPVRQTQ